MLLSSHILAEVEALCDRVSIIRAGRTVETGTLAELRHLTRTSVDRRDRPAAVTGSTTLPGVHDLARRRRPRRASTSTPPQLDAVLRRLAELGVRS